MSEWTAGAMTSSRGAVAACASGLSRSGGERINSGSDGGRNRSREWLDFHWSELTEGLAGLAGLA